MEEQTALTITDDVRLGSLQVTTPHAVVERASAVAKELANIVDTRKLYSVITGKKFVRVEGWSTLGAMLGVTPREVSVFAHDDGTYEAVVELVRVSDGAVIGRGSAICGTDEKRWGTADRYARRSMSITRATGKAFRLSFSWIMTLAGYEPTPAEEMDDNGQSAPVKIINPVGDNGHGKRLLDRGTLIALIAKEIPYYGHSKHVVAMLQQEEKAGNLNADMSDAAIFDYANKYAAKRADEKAAA